MNLKMINSFTSQLTSAGSIILPIGFKIASITIVSGSYTITNAWGQVSPVLASVYTFPELNKGEIYPQHTITWVSGTVIVTFIN